MKLREIRRDSGIKAFKVAEELNISRVQLYNLENGKYKIGKNKIEKLCEVYGKTEDEIIKAIKEGGK